MGRRASQRANGRRCRRALGRGARTFPVQVSCAAAAPGSGGRASAGERRSVAAGDARRTMPAAGQWRPRECGAVRQPAPRRRRRRAFLLPASRETQRGPGPSSRPSDPAGRLHRRCLLLGAIKANEPRASAQRSQLNRFGWFATWARCTRRPDTRWVRAVGARAYQAPGGFPASPPARWVVSLAWGAWRAAQTPGAQLEVALHPPPPALPGREGTFGEGCGLNWVVAIFLLLSLKPLEAARSCSPSRCRDSWRRVASDGGGATPPRRGPGRAPSAAAACPAAARECGAPALRAAGPGDQRASRRTDRESVCRVPLPDLTAARRHGARPHDGPVSIPGGEAVGAVRRPRGPRRWRGKGERGLEPAGVPERAPERGGPGPASAWLCGQGGGGRRVFPRSFCLKLTPPHPPASAAWWISPSLCLASAVG